MRPLSPFLLAAVAVFSCRTESISDVATNEVTANLSAVASGNGSTAVSATFRKGATSLTFLQLTSDDTVTASGGGQSQELKEFSLLGVVTYSASLPIDAQGTELTIALARKKDSGAPHSVATLPDAFTVDPLTGSFSRAAAGPMFHWSNAGSDPMRLTITGECINPFSTSVTSGATDYTVAAGALHKKEQNTADGGMAQIPDNCTANVELDRTRAGTLDTGYQGGGISAIQRRTVSFTTVP